LTTFEKVIVVITAPVIALVAVFDYGNGKTFVENFKEVGGLNAK